MIRFAIASGDKLLKEHLETCSRNAMYVSKTVQYWLLVCMANELICSIVSKVKVTKQTKK